MTDGSPRQSWDLAMRSNLIRSIFVAFLVSTVSDAVAEPVDYEREIKPVLQARCFACHGVLQQQGELRVDTARAMLAGGDSGSAIVPGEHEQSLLIERVADPDPGSRMPPEGEPLTAEQIERLRLWIDEGAVAPPDEAPEPDPREHWAFRPVVRPAVPQVIRSDWVRNPIDAFLAVEHERLGLAPQAEANRITLVRRLYLDLVGLPPSPEELAAAVDSTADDWYDRLVERLLDDPRHGERWARHWMDVWRYSDWWGLGGQLRNSQQHMWHWRDWIVESLNEDLPYDEMVRLMLAGDELAPDDPQRLRATGFLARNFFLFNRHQWMDETVEHVSKGFLGLTMNCAKCHDHKYDPLPQSDYYRMRAFFEPYHVRLDLVPDQADFDRDGLPRVFDALPDEPTYSFIRGDENQPDKSRVIEPGVPEILGLEPPPIAPIELPPAAWQPGRRPWVAAAHRQAKEQEIAAAKQALVQSQSKLTLARQTLADLTAAAELAKAAESTSGPATDEPLEDEAGTEDEIGYHETFGSLDESRWSLIGGDWSLESGQLSQRMDGAQRSALRWLAEPPRDFDISFRFTIRGGSKWRSVGISFDATHPDPAEPVEGDNDEIFVYLSGVAGGSKLQAAYRQAGRDHYPGEGMRGLPVETERPYTLRLQVRDTLINASLDDQPILAWRSPRPRQPGALLFTTFDALADFHEIDIKPLDPNLQLRLPADAGQGEPTTVDEAKRAVEIATADREQSDRRRITRLAERDSIDFRVAAFETRWDWEEHGKSAAPGEEDPPEAVTRSHADAVRAERRLAVARAGETVAEIRARLVRAGEDQRAAIDQELTTAQTKLDSAVAAVAAEVAGDEPLPEFVGARWTATRFLSSGADDPTPEFPSHSTGRRSALAEWITDPRNPLTARVAVNHIWMRHLGEPLVPTVFDFGRQGTPPAHPELLDWLAAEWIASGWSMKHLHQLIVTSAAYRMSSATRGREANVAIDRDNRLLWRRSPIRIESQVVRDSILALAGTLDLSVGGPAVPTAEQPDSKRRSLYFFHSNNYRDLFLTMFDEAPVTECYRRDQSIVPQQALALINSRLVLDAAAPIAGRISEIAATSPDGDDEHAAEKTDDTLLRVAFEHLLGSPPSDEELAAGREALAAWRALPEMTEERVRENLIWSLLNHNDFVTLR
ncbi:MAG: DUF1553 domain-containing protein [Planctomycetaceae bacterium]|nr:MAG: DUF1553 domain-containing protein [Planctomycetaceae bacterium]